MTGCLKCVNQLRSTTNAASTWRYCVGTSDGSWQDARNRRGRQGGSALLCAGFLGDFAAGLQTASKCQPHTSQMRLCPAVSAARVRYTTPPPSWEESCTSAGMVACKPCSVFMVFFLTGWTTKPVSQLWDSLWERIRGNTEAVEGFTMEEIFSLPLFCMPQTCTHYSVILFPFFKWGVDFFNMLLSTSMPVFKEAQGEDSAQTRSFRSPGS